MSVIPKCPLPAGRQKTVLTRDERKSIIRKSNNVRLARKAELDLLKDLDDASVTAKITKLQNTVNRLQGSFSRLAKKIANSTVSSPALRQARKNVFNTGVAESKARANINAEARQLRLAERSLYSANQEVNSRLLDAYISEFELLGKTTDPVTLKAIEASLKTLEKALIAQKADIMKSVKAFLTIKDVIYKRLVKLQSGMIVYTKANLVAKNDFYAELNRVDSKAAKDLKRIDKQHTGAVEARDTLVDEAARVKASRQLKLDEAIESSTRRDEFMLNLTDAVMVDPRKGRGNLDWLSSKLGITVGLAGRVKEALLESGRLAESAVNQIAQILSVNKLNDFVVGFKQVAAGKNIDPKLLRTLAWDTIERGQIPELLKFYNPRNKLVRKTQLDRYNRYVQAMKDAGFDQLEIDALINAGAEVSSVFNDVRKTAVALGVGIDTIEPFIGYATRIFSADGMRWLRRVMPESIPSAVLPDDALKFRYEISRKYSYYVPTDASLAAEILKIDEATLGKLLDNPNDFLIFLEESVTPIQLDLMVKYGLFDKLPMSSSEVYEYIMSQYPLPFTSPADMFNMNATSVMSDYEEALGKQARTSMMLARILDEVGVGLGWSVDSGTFNANRAAFPNFVSLGDKMQEWSARVGLDDVQKDRLAKTYVNVVVADQIVSIMEIVSNPALLSQLGESVDFVSGLFRSATRSILTANAPVYLAHQVLAGFQFLHAAGGNHALFIPAMNDLRMVLANGIDVLDNSRILYTVDGIDYTQRTAFLKFFSEEGANQAALFGDVGRPSPSTIQDVIKESVTNSKNGAWQLWMYATSTGEASGGKTLSTLERVQQTIQYMLEKGDSIGNTVSSPVFQMANFVDMSARWAAYMSLMKRAKGVSPAWNNLGKFVFSQNWREFDNFKELRKHVNDYMPSMSDVGSFSSGVNKYVIPFYSWFSTMMPRVARDVIRRPHRYAAYDRIRQFTLESCSTNQDITEGGMTKEQLGTTMFGLACVSQVDKDGKSDNKLVFWTDSSFNPTTQARDTISAVGGLFTQSAEEKRAELKGDFQNDGLQSLLKVSYPHVKLLYEQLTNTRVGTGTPLQSNEDASLPLLGMNWNPRLYSLVTNAIPQVPALDRTLANLGLITGSPDILDENGRVIELGEKGILGSVPRSNTRSAREEVASRNWVYRVLASLGGSLKVVDMVKNNRRTLSDIDSTITKVTTRFDSLQNEMIQGKRDGRMTTKTEEEYKVRLEELIVTREQLIIDSSRTYSWLNSQGLLTDKEIFQRNKTLNLIQARGESPLRDVIEQSALRLLEFTKQIYGENQIKKEEKSK